MLRAKNKVDVWLAAWTILGMTVLAAFLGAPGLSVDVGAGIRTGTGGGNGIGGGDCMPTPFVDNNAADIVASDGANVTLENSAASGSAWSLDRSDGANEPVYRAAGSCAGLDGPCVEFVGSDYLAMDAEVAHTWTQKVFCLALYTPAVTSGVKYAFAWDDFASRRTLQNVVGAIDGRLYINTAGAPTFPIDDGWHSLCFDVTDETMIDLSIDGAASFTVTASGTAASEVSFGLSAYSLDGLGDYPGLRFSRLVAYDDDPGQTVEELSACLKSQVGF